MSLSEYFHLGFNLSTITLSSLEEVGSDHFFKTLERIVFKLDFLNHPKFKNYVKTFEKILRKPNRTEHLKNNIILIKEILDLLNGEILNNISRKYATTYRLGFKLSQFRLLYNTPYKAQIYDSLCIINKKVVDYNLFLKPNLSERESPLTVDEIPRFKETIENRLSYP
ncbi:MAG: hypothetical protein ACXACO_19760 [Promethearchaeota archaeon]|jgi:hypothetical protein